LNRFNYGILLETMPLRKVKMESSSATRSLHLSLRTGEKLPQAGTFFSNLFPFWLQRSPALRCLII
jgi:hypothetical protein